MLILSALVAIIRLGLGDAGSDNLRLALRFLILEMVLSMVTCLN